MHVSWLHAEEQQQDDMLIWFIDALDAPWISSSLLTRAYLSIELRIILFIERRFVDLRLSTRIILKDSILQIWYSNLKIVICSEKKMNEITR